MDDGNGSMIYLAVYLRSAEAAWPQDAGDDPSFVASRRLGLRGGLLTWGVCWQDVRNALRPGDPLPASVASLRLLCQRSYGAIAARTKHPQRQSAFVKNRCHLTAAESWLEF